MSARSPLPLFGAVITLLAFCLDLRFRVSAGASFTLFEVTAWVFGLATLLGAPTSRELMAMAARQHWGFVGWALWAFVAGLLAVVVRQHAAMLPLWKNALPSLWLFLIIAGAVRGARDVRVVLMVLMVGVSVHAAIGLGQAVAGLPQIVEPDVYAFQKLTYSGGYATNAAMGLFGHPNNFGLFVAPIVAFAITLTIKSPRYGLATLAPLMIAVGLAALYYSYMKSAFAWMVIGVAVSFAPTAIRRPSVVIGSILALSMTMVVLGLAHSHENRMLTTISTRTDLWANAWASMTQNAVNFLFGADPVENAQRAKASMGWLFPHAHNGFINQGLYFGVPAGVLFLIGFGQGIGAAKASAQQRALAAGVLSMIVTLAGILPFENLSTTNMLAIPAVFSALAFTVRRRAAEADEPVPQPALGPRMAFAR